MKQHITMAALIAAALTSTASAQSIGVSMQSFDNNFQTLLRDGISARAGEVGASVQLEDAQTDVSKQLSQVANFTASGVDAVVLTLADTSSADAISAVAADAGIPLVYVNLEPANIDNLPDNQAYVGSQETDAGRLAGEAVCALLVKNGKQADAQVFILMGDLVHEATLERSQSFKDALAAGECKDATIAEEQSGLWQRTVAMDMTTNWLTAGRPIDVIFANNDEMAIGAIQALTAGGVAKENVIVAGIDATADGLTAMAAGDLDVTVFQNAKQQAASGVDAALALVRGEAVDKRVMVPFELVTPENMAQYQGQN